MNDYLSNYLIQTKKSNLILQNFHFQMCRNVVMSKLTRLLPKHTYDHLKVVEIFQTIQQLTELNK